MLFGTLTGLAIVVALAASYSASSARGLKPCPPPGSNAVNFSAYYLGDAFRGLPLTKTLRVCNKLYPPEPVRGNYISFIYGDCVPGSDGGCAPPVEVQSGPACERRLSARNRRRARTHKVRGVPALRFPGEPQLELFTGDAAVLIFGRTTAQVRKVAAALRSIPGSKVSVPADARLPKPLRGALNGKLRC